MMEREPLINYQEEREKSKSCLTAWDKLIITILFLELIMLITVEYFSGAESWIS
ncbi:MAG: hypothetical protein ACFFCS_29865 [Candidatus Hodarchaeota archaeon]